MQYWYHGTTHTNSQHHTTIMIVEFYVPNAGDMFIVGFIGPAIFR